MGEQMVLVGEAMEAYEKLQKVKEEMADMEREARVHYRIANEHHNAGNTGKSNREREIGNALMDRVIRLKLIIG